MLTNGCETGCKALTGGEIYHHKDCQFYKGSLSEELDKLREQVKKLNEPAVSKCDGIEREALLLDFANFIENETLTELFATPKYYVHRFLSKQ